MKKILKYTAILSVLASVVTTGCIKETFPTGSSISADQATASADALKSMTAAIHNYAANAEWAGSSVHSFYGLPSIGVHRDVMCNDLTIMDNPYGWYSQFQSNQGLSSTSKHIQIFWLIYTKIIALSNDVIRMNPDLDAIVDTNKGYVGAAYAYRALAMLEMAQMHEFKANIYTSKEGIEGLTVPYLHENMTVDYAKNNPRLTKAEAIEKIYELLDKAILLLDGHTPSTDKTLPDLAVAYGLYARTKLYEGDYANAKVYAEKALAAGSFSPLTKEQWTSVQNGFNNADSQSSWMLCIRTSSESIVVKRGIVNFTSFMSNENTYGYGGPGAGAYVMVDKQFYNQISNADFRKLSWKAPAGHVLEAENLFVPATDSYPGAEALPEYGALKFRPGEANPDDYLVGSAVDIPLMRMEEMKFIIAECDARNGDASSLIDIVKTRNEGYTCTKTGTDLIKEMFFQKRVEFWGEGIMFFDYKRCPELLTINRGYPGTNHPEFARFNVEGIAPWFNVPINGYEAQDNKALSETNNPDPSNTIQPWVEK